MTKLLRDLIEIPDRVTSGDFVLTLSDGVDEQHKDAVIQAYVVTEQLAACFDRALGLIEDAVERRRSNAAYLDGSFGSGKSHFMALLHAILQRDPQARGKKGLTDIVAKHDKWLADRKFLLVPYHVVESRSLEAAILGGYVAHVLKEFPDKPLPAVFVDDELIADASQMRADDGDQAFIARISRGGSAWQQSWNTELLDAALAAPPSDPERRRLIGDLLMGPFKRYARAVRADAESYISLDEGLSVISKHAKSVLGFDAVVLLLDELVLWLSGLVSDTKHMTMEAQKLSKLVESAENERPAPIISFIPRQRDLKDLVGRDIAGGQAGSLFDTLNYWAERFNVIKLEDRNLPAIVKERMLHVRPGAGAELDAAFEQTTAVRSQVWEALLDAQGGISNRESFRATYPFSPAFLHAMVDLSSALQRQRSALRLMQQLLVAYRDVLLIGQLMPLGAIYDVLTDGKDEPFSDKLKGEFAQAQTFYKVKLRPYLLKKHDLTEDQARALPHRHEFRSDDLIAKTLLLAALVPGVPALRNLTSNRLAALNHGSIVASLPGRESRAVTETLRKMANEFGEIRVSTDDKPDPAVEVALIGVDTKAILGQVVHVADESAMRNTIQDLLWSELDVVGKGQLVPATTVIWRGTQRTVELVFTNVRDREKVAATEFSPTDPGAIRFVIDYPFDSGTHSPAEDLRRVKELQADLDRPATLVWLPHFLSDDRKRDLEDLIKIDYLLDREMLTDYTPTLSDEDRHHARTQLDNRRAALRSTLIATIKAAYGIDSDRERDADLGARVEEHVLCLDSQLQLKPRIGQGFPEALRYMALLLLDHQYPKHPDFDVLGRRKEITRPELQIVLQTVEQAAQDKVGRLEVAGNNVAVLKRIANPLKVGVMHEAAFILGDEWKQLIDRRSGTADTVSVEKVRGWILEEQPALPPMVVDLLISCYAIQTDQAWIRGGQPQRDFPELGKITNDLVLRRQELPSQPEWESACERAAAIFDVVRPPVLSARAVQAVAADLRAKASEWLPAIEAHVAALKQHSATLAQEGTARYTTAQTSANLLNLLTVGDATTVIRALASAKLSKDAAIYRASLVSARKLTTDLAHVRWQLIDELPVLAENGGDKSEPARAILSQLRIAAGHDEHEVWLADALARAEQDTIALLTEVLPPPPPRPDGGQKLAPETTRHRVRGSRAQAVVAELMKVVKQNPDAEFEITWRILR